MRPSWAHCSRTSFTPVVVASQAPIAAADLIGAFKLVARQGFVVGVWGKDPEDLHMVIASSAAAAGPRSAGCSRSMTHMGRPVQAEDAGEERPGGRSTR